MVVAYRHKSKSDEVVSPSDLKRHGLIVWVGERPHREERICSGGALLTVEQYFKHKSERAARNRATFGDRCGRSKREHSFFVGGA